MIPPATAPAWPVLAPDTAEGLLLAFASNPPATAVEVMVTMTGVGGVGVGVGGVGMGVVLVERGTEEEEELEVVVREDAEIVASSTVK